MTRCTLYILFFLSGVSGLGYEILWTKMLSISLGHEIVAMLAVISAFFSGFALRAWFLDRPVSCSFTPGKWYVLFEIVIGLWALALVFILPMTNTFVADLIGVTPSPLRHWSIAFFYPFVVLLPATFAMGGTLPAMDRLFERLSMDGFVVAGLYSVNTFGAMAGTFLVTFLLIPKLGMTNSTIPLSLVNFVVAATVLSVVGKRKAPMLSKGVHCPHSYRATLRFNLTLFITGLLGIGFEVLMTRTFSQVFENTAYSFASLLVIFLFGTALGAWIYQQVRPSRPSSEILSFLLLTTAMFCLMAISLLQYVYPLFQVLQKTFGENIYGGIAAEMSLSALYFLLPIISMGATFSHLAQSLKSPDKGVGRALCLNTLGGAVAPFLFGVFLLPILGIKNTLLLVPVAYVLCLNDFRSIFLTTAVTLASIALFLTFHSDPNQFISLNEGDSVVSHKEGVMASVSVIKDDRQEFHLKVNNHFQMGGTTSVFSDRRQAYLPLLLHPNPEQALFLGLGTGCTFAAATLFPELKAQGVELIPEVIEAMPYFNKVTGDFDKFKNLQIINADARRYVMASNQKYDVIIADLFHPARDGAGNLYTVEHFQAIRELLQQNGLFCQWLPLYQLDLEMFKVITRTFLEVFPEGQAFLAHYSIEQPIIGLVGARHKLRFPKEWYSKRIENKELSKQLSEFGFDNLYSLFGTFIAGEKSLKEFSGSGSVNTDAHPVVLFQAPGIVYQSPRPPSERLLSLLHGLSPPEPDNILEEMPAEDDHNARSRLTAYWAARDSFLELGTKVQRTHDVVKLYLMASEPLLAVVKKSADFSAAYFPLISIAYQLYPYDAEASYKLFQDLEQANPLRPEAGILRQRLFLQ